ncbi:MAG: hypothetical protein ACI9UR_002007 [Bacteroidia bacterium]|jgi:hypothetical protein
MCTVHSTVRDATTRCTNRWQQYKNGRILKPVFPNSIQHSNQIFYRAQIVYSISINL